MDVCTHVNARTSGGDQQHKGPARAGCRAQHHCLLPKGFPAAGRAGEELPGCRHSPYLLSLHEDAPRSGDGVWPG